MRSLSERQWPGELALHGVHRTGCATSLCLLVTKCLFYGRIQCESCFHCKVPPGSDVEETNPNALPTSAARTEAHAATHGCSRPLVEGSSQEL